ncbi:MAG: hypothetical protein LBE33_10125 [Zoogloeaceae bacterium]|nr:hypothetical protein [Zoogloeaceae bacterium]
MNAYLTYDDGRIIELGEIEKSGVLALIEKAESSLSLPQEEYFGVGFCRNEDDFVEIRPVGKSQYMIWSDIIAEKKRGFLGLFSGRGAHIEKIVVGTSAAADAAYYYMDHSREEFETEYSA